MVLGDFGKIEKRTLFTNFFGLSSLLLSGYSLLISQLHGVDGGTGMSDSCGNKDINCINDLYRIFSKYSDIDRNKVGMIGGSSGGLITYQASKLFPWLKTGIIIASSVDEKQSLEQRNDDLKVIKSQHYNILDKMNLFLDHHYNGLMKYRIKYLFLSCMEQLIGE
ncbi:MAG: hypothetical protein HC932_02405 [Thermales bacterium]|nr:hypothetical protein [Thermales bacterium]